jgi:peptidoglycan hydrolase FlgJ
MTPEMNIKTIAPEAGVKPDSSKMSDAELKKLKKTCADFESIFTYQLLKTMRQTIPQTQIGMSNSNKDTYNMMMDQKLAETISAKGTGLGLQKVLFDQLTKTYKQSIPKEVTNKLK